MLSRDHKKYILITCMERLKIRSYDEWKSDKIITLEDQLTILRLARDIMEWNDLNSPQLKYLISNLWTKKNEKYRRADFRDDRW